MGLFRLKDAVFREAHQNSKRRRSMKVGDRLAELLAENGVEHIFGVPGGQTLPLYEGIRKLGGRITHVLMRDERSAGFAADAYARLTNRTGVCDATVGPGATNLVSPLAEAYCSSIPVLAIVSDIARSWEHRRMKGNASQGIEQLEIFRSVSKWQIAVTDPRALENILDTAFRIATTGKPGPVVISIPDDIGSTDFEFKASAGSQKGALFPRFRSVPDPEEVSRAAGILLQSRRPVLVVGGGAHISGASRKVSELAEHLHAPLITTISGKGIIPENHPLSFGVTGSFGNPVAAEIMGQADCVFFIGSKAGQLTTFNYRTPKKQTPVIHLDADPEEIGRNFANSLPLLGDARLGVDAVLSSLNNRKPHTEWDLAAFKEKHRRWYDEKAKAAPEPGKPLKPQAIMEAVNQSLTDEDIIVCDASLASGWAAAYLQLRTAGRRFMAPRGLAGLGWGAPAAIGAALASSQPGRILCLAGDGGFSYSVQELEVMKRFNLPVVSLVLNNDVLGWIKHVQRDFYQEKYISTDFSHVDFSLVARGFGARGYTARTLSELREALELEKSPQGPAVIEVISDPWESPILRI
jgi:acetolactate synthase-1/2/3 large subunit